MMIKREGLPALLCGVAMMVTGAPALASGDSGSAAHWFIFFFFLGVPFLCPVPLIIALVRRRHRLGVLGVVLAAAGTAVFASEHPAIALVVFWGLWIVAMLLALQPKPTRT